MDLSLSALFERLSGRTPGSTLSHLGLRTYNDVFNAANSNANPIPTASHATLQQNISNHILEVQPIGQPISHLGSRMDDNVSNAEKSNTSVVSMALHSTIQGGTSGHIPETQHTDPAYTMNTQIEAAESWISRPPPRSTTPAKLPSRLRGAPRKSRALRRRDARERKWGQMRETQQQRPLVAVGTPSVNSHQSFNPLPPREMRQQQVQQPKPAPVQLP
ncbi:hypothetical protein B0J13DRAFT_653767 [Dactylonectria estremocensis]|uniref:Uncharacterized protein n=1 Tax=Dactylonectria estremocensis TaxID=1079267 RepID=A0A9P9DB72_9HYPO|nr:hypothetical protein B0J13DRAFT_653767 [Dactylonectria estremocensis]